MKICEKGSFPVSFPRAQIESIEAPKLDRKVHHVGKLAGAMVEDTEGHRFPVKQVLAAPGTSEDVDVPDELFPNAARWGEQKEALKQYADDLKERIRGDEQRSFVRVVQFLEGRSGLEDTMGVQRMPRVGRWVKCMPLSSRAVDQLWS